MSFSDGLAEGVRQPGAKRDVVFVGGPLDGETLQTNAPVIETVGEADNGESVRVTYHCKDGVGTLHSVAFIYHEKDGPTDDLCTTCWLPGMWETKYWLISADYVRGPIESLVCRRCHGC